MQVKAAALGLDHQTGLRVFIEQVQMFVAAAAQAALIQSAGFRRAA